MPKTKKERAAYMRQYYINNPDYAQRRRDTAAKRRDERKAWLKEKKEQLYCQCGENHIACLQFHHRDPSQKDTVRGGISQMVFKGGWSIKRLEEEFKKCDVICANCHAKLHYDETH